MAIVSRHISASLRLTEDEGHTIHSYQRIRPDIQGSQVDNFLQAINGLTGRSGGNGFLTITTELIDDSV